MKVFAQISYAPVREADVMWSKRVWRIIDLREKINLSLYYPTHETSIRNSLFDVIRKGILSRKLDAYDSGPAVFDPDEEFKTKLSFENAKQAFTREVTIPVQDTSSGEITIKTIIDTIGSTDITQYWIKEEWFFDKQRSVMDVRILGIAPVMETKDEQGEFKGYKVLFWLYFPDCRNYFSKFNCYNSYNDEQEMTFDDLFQKRMFGSYISQESNVYNRPIVAYAHGTDALLESEKIQQDIFKFEDNLWHH